MHTNQDREVINRQRPTQAPAGSLDAEDLIPHDKTYQLEKSIQTDRSASQLGE
jgi:hypothetical protein